MRALLPLILVVLAGTAGAQAASRARPPRDSAPVINVIYPPEGHSIGPYDSTFILGSVTPGSKLTINGAPIEVYRTGGFIGWVGLKPGDFTFRLRAKNSHGVDSHDVAVKVAEDIPIPLSTGAKIREGSVRPQWDRTVRTGDEVSISFDGTIGAVARYWILTDRDSLGPFPMTELRSRSLANYEAYQRDEILAPDSLRSGDPSPSRGRYHGLWRVPTALNDDSLAILVELDLGQGKSRTARVMPPGRLIAVESQLPRVIELKDSIQILRTGPRMGYFAINQPFGIRALWWGENGPWTIVRPAPGVEAWIETEKITTLPEGTPLPETIVTRMNTVGTAESARLEVGMSERLPFNVSVEDDLMHATILVYGAVSNTDWIERDSSDDLFSSVRWSQPAPQVYRIDLDFARPLWGYDARYEDSRFVFEVYRSPIKKSGLDGLTICVDPGHSADPGAAGPTGLVEKDANLAISLALQAQLETLGAKVVMTRTDDEDVELADRPGIAFHAGTDIFVSVHNNAVPDGIDPRRDNGTAVYYHHPHSAALARAVHLRVLKATGLPDYGLTQANFAVIRPPQYPAILIECAFIILPEQEELLENEAFITRTARGIAAGIDDFVSERSKR